VKRARLLVRRAIAGGLALGAGHGPVHALADLAPRLALPEAMAEMQEALAQLEARPGLGCLVPEVRCQMAYAPPGAASPQEVLGVAGRITAIGGRMRAAGPVMLDASRHVAKIVLTAMRTDPDRRTALALRFDERTLKAARALGWRVGEFSRADEPAEVKAAEGSSLEWGTGWVIEKMGLVPDLIFDRGEDGKEPVIRLLAATPAQAVEMLMQLAGQEDL
jgi:hydroxymethylpyrimidine/phosphomethylpyrimidine kinase